ncbi:hypothetical protein J6590_003619 [Homalodisca vitripennis]|nr:hypothetical protein J6590_003619 [Homalodisca vitripennis]
MTQAGDMNFKYFVPLSRVNADPRPRTGTDKSEPGMELLAHDLLLTTVAARASTNLMSFGPLSQVNTDPRPRTGTDKSEPGMELLAHDLLLTTVAARAPANLMSFVPLSQVKTDPRPRTGTDKRTGDGIAGTRPIPHHCCLPEPRQT